MSHFSAEQNEGNHPTDNSVSSLPQIKFSKKVPSLSSMNQVSSAQNREPGSKSNFEVARQSQSELVKESFMSSRKSQRSGNMISGRNSIDFARERVPIKGSKPRACCVIF
jgi:hypothetical protein